MGESKGTTGNESYDYKETNLREKTIDVFDDLFSQEFEAKDHAAKPNLNRWGWNYGRCFRVSKSQNIDDGLKEFQSENELDKYC